MDIEYSYSVFGRGEFGALSSLLLTVVVLCLVLFLLRGQSNRFNRRGLAIAVVATSVLVALLLGWTFYQPSLFVRKTRRQPGRLVLIVDNSPSMAVADGVRDTTELLDTVELIEGKRMEGRVRSPGMLARLLLELSSEVGEHTTTLEEINDWLAQGLPWTDRFSSSLESLRLLLTRAGEQVEGVCERLRTDCSRISAEIASRAADISLVAEEFSKVSELSRSVESAQSLKKLIVALEELSARLKIHRQKSLSLQSALDERLFSSLSAKQKENWRMQANSSRLGIVKAVLRNLLSKRFTQTHRVTLLELGGKEVRSPDSLTVSGTVTDLLKPLREVLSRYSRDVVTGVVVLSDGRHNSGSELSGVLEAMRGKSVPLYTVAVGSEREPEDVALIDYALPSFALKGKAVRVPLLIKAAVRKGSKVKLTLISEGEALAELELEANDEKLVKVTPEVTFNESGERELRVALSAERDSFPENNELRESIRVVEKKPECVVLSDAPGWDFRFLTRVLDRLSFEVKNPLVEKRQSKLPDSDEGWGRYDLVILFGYPNGYLARKQSRALKGAVEKGLGLLLLPSPEGDLSVVEELAELFGWEPARKADRLSFTPPPRDLCSLAPFLLRGTVTDSLKKWHSLSRPSLLSPVPPQDVVLLSDHGVPIMSYGLCGKGRCLIVGVADIYRLCEFSGRTDAERFVEGLLRMILRENATGEVRFLPEVPIAGERTVVLVQGEWAEVSWKQGGLSGTISMKRNTRGVLRGEVRFPFPGTATLLLRNNSREMPLTVPVRRILSKERMYFGVNLPLLEGIAERSGGKFVQLRDIYNFLDTLQPRKQVEIRVREHTLWHSRWSLLLLAFMLTAIYVMRRKGGMVM